MQEGHISYITQIGTGNYNEKTAKLYTDLSLMTADQGIGEETNEVFQHLSMGQVMPETELLMVAPKCLRNKILDKIDEQIALAREGEPAYVGAKMNSLTVIFSVYPGTPAIRQQLPLTISSILTPVCDAMICLSIIHLSVRDVADRVVFMADGYVVEEGKPELIFTAPKERRTQTFLSRVLPATA